MAIQFPAGITEASLVANAQARLVTLQKALDEVNEFGSWLAGVSAADLEASPVSLDTTSAPALLAAFADAVALYDIYTTGQAPATYPQVTGPYVYAASIRAIIEQIA